MKLKLREWIGLVAIAVVAAPLCIPLAIDLAYSASPDIRPFLMIAGDTDSTEQVTRWIPIKGAARIVLRSWTQHIGFGANADTTKVDSIAGMRLLFSDSICCNVPGPERERVLSAADSFVVVPATGDTTTKGMAAAEWPINKVLRGAATGSGILTYVYPVQPFTLLAAPDQYCGPGYMRVRFTPLRRSTGATVSATVPNRTNGLRGFKMMADVIYVNQ
jgi:hypothetical protein